tara:strand:+ start:142 stop:1116 length:975 start_codon:yes stop_codon:yes gene_type:complete
MKKSEKNISVQLNAECKKALKGDNLAAKANAAFHVYVGAVISLGNTLAFIIESMQKLKFTADEKSTLRQKLVNVRGTWTDAEKEKLVASATDATGKQQSAESLGIQFSRKRDTVQRSALIKGQEVLAWTTIKWLRVINNLATGDQFAEYPAINVSDSYADMMKKVFKHCYVYKGNECTLAEELEKLYTNVDYADAKAASNAASAALIVSRVTKMLTNGNKAIANAYRKFKTELADDFAGKRKRAALVKRATDHINNLIKSKVGKVKPLAVIKCLASAAKVSKGLTGSEDNRIAQLLADDSRLADFALGRAKSSAIRKALPTLKS